MPENTVKLILKEVESAADQISQEQINKAAGLIAGHTGKIFCMGAGRSGLIARAMANRLLHLGKQVWVIGDITTPPVGQNDLIIAVSSSGRSSNLVSTLEKVVHLQARILLITAAADSPAARLSSSCIVLLGTSRLDQNLSASSVQPVGSLFEQLAWLCADAVILEARDKIGLSNSQMLQSHANLE